MAKANEPLSGIDKFLAEDEDDIAALDKSELSTEDFPEEEKLDATAPETPEPEPTPEPTPTPEPETEPTAEPTPEPEVAEPAEPAPEPVKEKPRGTLWKEHKQLQRALKQKDAEIEALKQARETPPAAPAAPAEEEIYDPIEQAQRDAREAKKDAAAAMERAEQLAEQAQRNEAQRQLVDEIRTQEAAFKAEHPDYDEAMNYLVESRRGQFEVMGVLDAEADAWIEKNPEAVERQAQEMGLNPEDYDDIKTAAKDIAFRLAIQNERQALVMNCKRTGRNVAQTVYSLAEQMGHKSKAAAPAAPAPIPETAKERIQKAKEAAQKREPFTQKLASMPTNPSPLPKKVSTRSDLLKMDEKDLDKLIDEMDQKDPTWFERLGD